MGKEDKTIGKLKKEHSINNKFRYQIRLGKNYLELWTKEVSEHHFRFCNIKGYGDIPDIEEDEYSPIKGRKEEGISNKRGRSESPEVRKKSARIENTEDEDEILNVAMDEAVKATEEDNGGRGETANGEEDETAAGTEVTLCSCVVSVPLFLIFTFKNDNFTYSL